MLDSRAPNWLARHSSAAQLREPSGVLAPFLTFAKRIQHMLNESAYLAMIRRQIDLESSGPHDEFRNWFNGRDSNLISQMAAVLRRVRTESSLAASATQTSYWPIFSAPTAAPGPMFTVGESRASGASARWASGTRIQTVRVSPHSCVHQFGDHAPSAQH